MREFDVARVTVRHDRPKLTLIAEASAMPALQPGERFRSETVIRLEMDLEP